MATVPLHNTRWLTEREVAQLVGVSISSLQKARHFRRGIPYSKIGRNTVRYSLADVEAYMVSCRIDVTSI